MLHQSILGVIVANAAQPQPPQKSGKAMGNDTIPFPWLQDFVGAAAVQFRHAPCSKLSWADTYKAMANEGEEWSEYDQILLDGLEDDDFDA